LTLLADVRVIHDATEAAKKIDDFVAKYVHTNNNPERGEWQTAKINMKRITDIAKQMVEVEVKIS